MTKNIYLTEEITMESMGEILQQINTFNEESAEILKVVNEMTEEEMDLFDEDMLEEIRLNVEEAKEPINFHISSGGGDVWATWGIVGAMERSVLPIITYGYGIVGSGALAIFLSGDSRHMSKHASLMYHSVAYGADYLTLSNHEEGVKVARNMQNTYADIVLSNSEVPSELLDKAVSDSRDLYFTAEKALDYKMVENIF